ncbi:MAG: RNA 2',3'-cyclic phosphodiesterase [Candidatus Promineofilum sp.]|nr:RNA 2',3'-cyclic phosphodiesterase [Promineifilum sp.]
MRIRVIRVPSLVRDCQIALQSPHDHHPHLHRHRPAARRQSRPGRRGRDAGRARAARRGALGAAGADAPDAALPGRHAGRPAAHPGRRARHPGRRPHPFTLRLSDVGCFPNARRPRVVWVGLGGEEAKLTALVAALEAALRPLGWPPEDKPFRAHLTLGRVKDERAAQGVDWSAAVPALDVPVTALHLIESQLRPEGPVYTVRHTSVLVAQVS